MNNQVSFTASGSGFDQTITKSSLKYNCKEKLKFFVERLDSPYHWRVHIRCDNKEFDLVNHVRKVASHVVIDFSHKF